MRYSVVVHGTHLMINVWVNLIVMPYSGRYSSQADITVNTVGCGLTVSNERTVTVHLLYSIHFMKLSIKYIPYISWSGCPCCVNMYTDCSLNICCKAIGFGLPINASKYFVLNPFPIDSTFSAAVTLVLPELFIIPIFVQSRLCLCLTRKFSVKMCEIINVYLQRMLIIEWCIKNNLLKICKIYVIIDILYNMYIMKTVPKYNKIN